MKRYLISLVKKKVNFTFFFKYVKVPKSNYKNIKSKDFNDLGIIKINTFSYRKKFNAKFIIKTYLLYFLNKPLIFIISNLFWSTFLH